MGTTTPATPPERAHGATAPHTPWSIRAGDSLDELPTLRATSVDAVICDPPYGIDFQRKAWDGRAIRRAARQHTGRRLPPGDAFEHWVAAWSGECLRVLKPGAHLAAFGAPRTFHRLVSGIENTGLEIRDVLLWLYATGMPKSRRLPGGQGTALKPAYEPILLARKPPTGSIEANVRAYGTGALNIDACRVDGRWPANVLLAHHPACTPVRCHPDCPREIIDAAAGRGEGQQRISRLFYCPKASRRERDAGCEQLPRQPLDLFPRAQGDGRPPPPAANAHPTVKPLAVMRWLVRLITPDGGLVLDPFCGSGTTGCAAVLEHRRFLGIEREHDYVTIAQARIAHWAARAI